MTYIFLLLKYSYSCELWQVHRQLSVVNTKMPTWNPLQVSGQYPAVVSVGRWQLPVVGVFGTSLSVGAKDTFHSKILWPAKEQGSDTGCGTQTNVGVFWWTTYSRAPMWGWQRLSQANSTVWWVPLLTPALPFLFPGIMQGQHPGDPSLQHILTTKALTVKVKILMRPFSFKKASFPAL